MQCRGDGPPAGHRDDEGFGFIDRLIDDWLTGVNRFENPGELFIGGFQEGRLLAVCGLNRDPYTDRDGVGRLR
jgi:hypothetical protein